MGRGIVVCVSMAFSHVLQWFVDDEVMA
jgi:hypothetical protein